MAIQRPVSALVTQLHKSRPRIFALHGHHVTAVATLPGIAHKDVDRIVDAMNYALWTGDSSKLDESLSTLPSAIQHSIKDSLPEPPDGFSTGDFILDRDDLMPVREIQRICIGGDQELREVSKERSNCG